MKQNEIVYGVELNLSNGDRITLPSRKFESDAVQQAAKLLACDWVEGVRLVEMDVEPQLAAPLP
jgi:hypothetical protein